LKAAQAVRKRPTALAQRVLVAVFGAVCVLFLMIFIMVVYGLLRRESGDLDRSLLQSVQTLARALDTVPTDEGAQAAVTLYRNLIDAEASASGPQGQPPPSLRVVRRNDGLRLPVTAPVDIDPLTLPDGIGQVAHGGRKLRTYTASTARWKITLADDHEARTWVVLRDTASELGGYLLLTLPAIGVPVWWSVRTSLAPLKRLSDVVAARAPGDLRPLDLPRSWRELLPLQDALNRLFERVASSFEREKGFVHDAAHELRTPLAVISAQAHLLAEATGTERELARRQLDGAVARASHLAQQLLRLAQADALALAPRQRVDVVELAQDTLAGFGERAAAQGTELSLAAPERLLAETDPEALRSMLENGVDNALRYGGPGGWVEVRLEAQAQRWQLRVVDSGPGVAPAQREQAFERFWRGPGERERGAGLGLAIVREAARSLGGDARLTDPPAGGTGCCLAIDIPF
jgi:signal transduction histidine kinase